MAWSGQAVAAVAGPRLSEGLGRTVSEAGPYVQTGACPSGLHEAGDRRRGDAVPERAGATGAPADELAEVLD